MGKYNFDKRSQLHPKCRGCVRRDLGNIRPGDCNGIELWDWRAQGKPPMTCYVDDVKELARETPSHKL